MLLLFKIYIYIHVQIRIFFHEAVVLYVINVHFYFLKAWKIIL